MFNLKKPKPSRSVDATIAVHAKRKTTTTKSTGSDAVFESLSALMPTSQQGMTMGSVPVMLDLSPLLSGFMYHREEKSLVDVYKDIYLYDAVAGTAVDLLSFLPFSEFTLRGLTDSQQRPFLESLERLNIYTLLPEVSVDYLAFGNFIGSLIFNQEKKIFIDIIPQDFKNCTITRLPFYGVDPIINVTLPGETVSILTSSNQRVQQIVKNYGQGLIDKLVKGKLELDPLSTIYLPRRTMSNAEGISYYRRILPLYFLEKNIFRGTLVESIKRQRAILHITAGDLDWEPSSEDLQYISELFINADNDPLGAIIATRNGISTNDVRCIAGSSLINTDRGLIKIQDMVAHDPEQMVEGTRVKLKDVNVRNHTGQYVPAKFWWYQGRKPTFSLVLDDGTELETTAEHKFLTLGEDMRGEFTKLKDLKPGMFLLKPVDVEVRTALYKLNLECPKIYQNQGLKVPEYMNPKLAYCLALIISEGNITPSRVDVVNSDKKIIDKLVKFMGEIFGIIPKEHYIHRYADEPEINTLKGKDVSFTKHTWRVLFNSRPLVEILRQLGLKPSCELRTNLSPSHHKTVPDCIMQADHRSQLAFISGYLDGDGSKYAKNKGHELRWRSNSKQIMRSIHAMLSDLGYLSVLRLNNAQSGVCSEVYMSWGQASGLIPNLIYSCKFKGKKNVNGKRSRKLGIPSHYIIRLLLSREIKGSRVRETHRGKSTLSFYNDDGVIVQVDGNWRRHFKHQIHVSNLKYTDYRTNFLYDAYEAGKLNGALEIIKQVSEKAYKSLMFLFKHKTKFCEIVKITEGPVQHVYDLTMSKNVPPVFTAQGICFKNSGGDFWNIDTIWGSTTPMKLKALNISEDFVNGSASVATMEASMSGFVEQLRSYRAMITRKLFYNKIFPLISLTNELYIDDNARRRADELKAKSGRNSDLSTLLYQVQDTSSLLIPEIDWDKNLKPEGDSGYIDILKTMTDAGVPVPIRALAAAGGIKLDRVLKQSEDDLALRKRLADYQAKIAESNPKKEGEGYEGYSSMMTAMFQQLRPEDQQQVLKDLAGQSRSSVLREQARPSLLDRKFNPEITTTSKTGKIKSVYNQRFANERANLKILKALRSVHQQHPKL